MEFVEWLQSNRKGAGRERKGCEMMGRGREGSRAGLQSDGRGAGRKRKGRKVVRQGG